MCSLLEKSLGGYLERGEGMEDTSLMTSWEDTAHVSTIYFIILHTVLSIIIFFITVKPEGSLIDPAL
jgi:hypothetical protein